MTVTIPSGAASPRGDRRREALLAALDERLRTTQLDDISVADLTEGAGITRSAFYFYFDSKAAAVGVLLVMVNEEARTSAESIIGEGGTLRTRVIEALGRLVDKVVENGHIYRALLTARTKHQRTREMWDEGRGVLAELIAEFIRAERAAGRAPDGVAPRLLAAMLISINESVLERMVYDPDGPRDALLATAADMWVRSIYGRVGADVDAHVDAASGPASHPASHPADPGRNP